jgi:DNA-directed RNA polymerase sigma subunit (sigma70/sigma32)
MLERSNFVDQLRVAAEGDFVYELKSILGQNAAGLSDVEQQVVVARFGLDADRDAEAAQRVQTLEQVGELIGVTKERVRQIQMKALGKLRVALEQAVSTR